MFSVTIQDARNFVIAKGQSFDGETWEQAFARILGSVRPSISPVSEILRSVRCGTGTYAVVVSHQDGDGRRVLEMPLVIRTHPPQH